MIYRRCDDHIAEIHFSGLVTAAWLTNFPGNFFKIIHYHPTLQAKLSFLILWIDLKYLKKRYLLTDVELS